MATSSSALFSSAATFQMTESYYFSGQEHKGGCKYASDRDCDACRRCHRVLQPLGRFGSTSERSGHRRSRGCRSNGPESALFSPPLPSPRTLLHLSSRPLLHLSSLRSVWRRNVAPTF